MDVRYDKDKIQELAVRYKEDKSDYTFSELLTECKPIINDVVYKSVPPAQSALDYDDLVQMGSITLFETINWYEPSKGFNFTSSLYNNLKRGLGRLYQVQSYQKRNAKDNVLSINEVYGDSGDDKATLITYLSHSKYLSMELDLQRDRIDKVKDVIDYTDRQIIDYMEDGLNYKEIGEVMGLQQDTVNKRVIKIRSKATMLKKAGMI